jgi:hypothetical protein
MGCLSSKKQITANEDTKPIKALKKLFPKIEEPVTIKEYNKVVEEEK